ncbi:unnamed protein product [Closterium sp. NIES-65]|nr:unnamed protein product [Closterium sp. NIES-65]
MLELRVGTQFQVFIISRMLTRVQELQRKQQVQRILVLQREWWFSAYLLQTGSFLWWMQQRWLEQVQQQQEGFHLLYLILRLADTPPTSTNYGKNFTNLPALVTSISSAIIEQLPSSTTSGTPAGTAGAGAAAAGAAAAGAGAADAAQPTSTGTAGQESTRGSGREGERAGGVYFDEPQRGSVGGMGGGEGIVYPPIPAGPLYDDLHPGGGAGIMPSRPGFGGGSMLVGPHDPRWGPTFPGGVGGMGPLPPGMPSGARFDPFGPPGIPGFEPGRFGDGRPRPRGPPGGGVHPDMQHFPGSDDFL